MRRLCLAVASAVLMTASPVAAGIQSAFGNTVVSHYPDGGWVRHWFDADGSYRAQFSDGRRLTGLWRVEGDRICLNNIRPRIMMMSRFCTDMIEASIGDTWHTRDPLGRRVRNELVRGRI